LASTVNCFSDLKNPQKQRLFGWDWSVNGIVFSPGFVVNYKLMKRGDKKFDIKIF
jgi:hypothetical protein